MFVFVSIFWDFFFFIIYKSIKVVWFGDNIVDYNSIYVDLLFIIVDKYFEKLMFKGEIGEKLVC